MNDTHSHRISTPDTDQTDAILGEMLKSLPGPAFLMDEAGQVLGSNGPGAKAIAEGSAMPDAPTWAGLADAAPVLPHKTAVTCGTGSSALSLDLSRLGTREPARFLLRGAVSDGRKSKDFALAIHDLRTQLQSIMASGDLLGEQTVQLNAEATRYLQAIQSSAQAALLQVSDALKLAHDAPTEMAGATTDQAPAQVIAEVVQRFLPLAQRNGCRVEAKLPAVDLWVKAPDRAIQTLVENLLGNAIKFSQSQLVEVHLEAKPMARDKRIRLKIEVVDHGIGLPQAQRRRIQKILAHGGPAESDMEGHGLGTYAIRRAMDSLGGRIKYHETDGGGATFRAEFTLSAARLAQRRATERTRADTGRLSLGGMQILIVDDNDVNRTLFERILSTTGAEISVSPSGEDALKQLARSEQRFDVVLLDLSMPGMDGISVASMIEQSPPPAGRPVVIGLTAHTEEEWLSACQAVGMHSVLTKPLRPDTLRQTVAGFAGMEDLGIGDTPVPLINPAVYDEIEKEMGPDMAVGLARKAVAEAEAFCDRVMESGITQVRRQELHSALGSSGMTGMSSVEHALRRVQSVSRVCDDNSTATMVALDLLRSSVVRTAGALEVRDAI